MLLRRLALISALAALSAVVHGQALPTATRNLSFTAGAGVSIAKPDYSTTTIKGITFFGTADLRNGLGIDVEYHDTNLITPLDLGEKTFLAGLRYGRRVHRFYPYAKGLAGVGTFLFSKGYYPANSSASYHAYAFGGGVEFRASRHITLRLADAEYQDWTTFSPHNLTPTVYTAGAAYRY